MNIWPFRKRADQVSWEEMNREILGLVRGKRYEEALKLAKELFAFSKKNYGKKHHRTIKAVNNLGFIQKKARRYDAAESYLLMALQLSEEFYGKYSREVALVNMNLSRLYRAKAEEILEVENACRKDEDPAVSGQKRGRNKTNVGHGLKKLMTREEGCTR